MCGSTLTQVVIDKYFARTPNDRGDEGVTGRNVLLRCLCVVSEGIRDLREFSCWVYIVSSHGVMCDIGVNVY